MYGSGFLWKERGFHRLNRMEARSSGSPTGNLNRSPAAFPAKISHSSDIEEATKTGRFVQSRSAFIT
jgi:hypothetical protein